MNHDAIPFRSGLSQPVAASPARKTRGRIAHLSGAMAEESVARVLEQHGMTIVARRWRGSAGEIDLIARQGDCVVFVEVKQAATHAEAALRLGTAQQGRIMRAALEYCADTGHPTLPEMRFDAALVDASGRVEILERAFDDACG